jgi:hypothetical protein
VCLCLRGENTVLLHEAAGIFPCGAANRHTIKLRGRHANTYWHSLAIFAAGAYAFIEAQIVSDHGHVLQSFRTVTDQCCTANRGSHFAVFDQIRL